jgi:DNA polymerase III subunit gamma/tau
MNFYNEYRPHRFSDLLGQEQNVAILKSQTIKKNWHHAYLLYGASGTGKTTTARILAMALNCYQPDPEGEPCGKCASCETIMKGQNWDCVEFDAGRFRGIDDVKDMTYKAYLSPFGNKKVYILDECHQLTEAAWNSLLKILEEPPPHLVLILCTTDYKKLPPTIISRCQLYSFNKLKPEDIKRKLSTICRNIGQEPDTNSLQFIVEKADGNMRMAENILEQVCVLKEK